MKTELTTLLCNRYPLIFAKRCEISVGDGWFNILDRLCGCIQHHIEHRQRRHDNAVRYNDMARALTAGNEEPFLQFYDTLRPELLEARRIAILAGDLQEVCEICPQVEAVQIKEKFGGLRFYVDGGDAVTEGMITIAECMSAVTCEECGSPGILGGRGWLKTLCPAHRLEWNKK